MVGVIRMGGWPGGPAEANAPPCRNYPYRARRPGSCKSANAPSPDAPDGIFPTFDLGPQGPHGCCGAKHVFAFEQTLDPAFTDRDGGQHQGAM